MHINILIGMIYIMRKIWILSLGMFALGMDTYIIAGLLPDIEKSFGKTSSEIGQGVTVFTLFFALSAPIFSAILAKYTAKRNLLVALLVFGIANLTTMISPNYSIYILSRCIAGLGAGLFSPIAVSSIGYLVNENNKGKAISFTIGGMSVGTVIGVPLGLQLSSLVNWRVTIGIIIVISTIALINIFFLFPSFKIPASPSLKDRFATFGNLHILRVVFVTIFTAITSLGLYTYLSQIINEFLPSHFISLFLTAWGIGGLIGSFGVGFISDKFKNINILMIVTLVTLGGSIVSIPHLINIPILRLLPFILWGTMGWATQPLQQQILLKKHSKHGSIALNSSLNYLGSAIGSGLGGLLLTQSVSTDALIYSGGSVIILAIVLQLINILID